MPRCPTGGAGGGARGTASGGTSRT
uniref:Uncharacterized protein n=1 Tax=Arundo donax TaxID=35708 RepID=A0A0A9GC16_ARUDO